ncbi:MAG: hypothetical protein Q7R96_05510 [Nanoarchaeota archaeon]|nr:hypothetical protein [Nanoarchaeota archaeon]
MACSNYAVFKVPLKYRDHLDAGIAALPRPQHVTCFLEHSVYAGHSILAVLESERQSGPSQIREFLKQLRSKIPVDVRPTWVNTNVLSPADLDKIINQAK